MDRDTAVTRIQDGLGFRTDLSSKIVLRLQEAQRKFEKGKTLPWFLKDWNTLTLTISTSSISYPATLIREVEKERFYYIDDDDKIVRLIKKGLEAAQDAYPDTATSPAVAPLVYASDDANSRWNFYPAPADATYTIYALLYVGGDVLTTNVENVWLLNAPELLIGEAGFRMAQDLRDGDAMTTFKALRDDAWDAIFRETIAREDANRLSHLGEDF